ncbi:MAG: SCP2 sterol-binding domain-containing protein [Proteobacteria bacterium]|nr:SCP2 sterol-binding domain-containing protein [Pseudomonadota bacterium]
MSGKIQYLSEEWRAEAERRLKAEITPEKMKNMTASLANVFHNCPDGNAWWLFFGYENGELARLEVGQGDPPAAEFTVSGDYDVFARISRAELGSQRALMTGKLKLKGNMVKALKLASVVDRLNKVLAGIEAEY